MPLQVWLPLIDNLDNYGINNLVSAKVQTGVSQSSDGKLGKCYKNTGTTRSVATTVNFSADTFSLCAWVRIDSRNNNWCRAVGLYGSDSYMGLACEHTNGTGLGFHYYKTIDGTNTSVFDTYPITSDNGVWVHYVMCYDGTKYYIYKNGSLVTSANANRSNIRAEMNTLYLFGGTSGNYSNHSLNDVRVYDECLSVKQVKLLSQGLVAHYTLGDRGQENLALNSHRNIALNSSYNIANFDLSEELTAGNKYTVTIKGVLGTDKWFGVWMGGGYTHCGYCTQVSENIFRLTFTSPTTVSGNGRRDAINIYAGPSSNTNQSSLEWLKIERGDKATSWLPNSADAEYTIMGYNESIVYDSSGFNHHGKKEGTISVDSNTPRYSVSTKFAASSGSFSHLNITLSQFTFSFWAKHIAANRMLMGSNASLTSSNTNWYWYGDNSFKYEGGEYYYQHNAGSAESLLGTWIHFVATYDGTNITVYRNGVNEGSKAATGDKTLEYLSIGNGYTSGWAGGWVSDFRLYTTCLSAEDVKQLYHTPVSIANNGSMLTQGEFVEL